MNDTLDQLLHEHGRRWAAAQPTPPGLGEAVRDATQRRNRRTMLAVAAAVVVVAAVTVGAYALFGGRDQSHPEVATSTLNPPDSYCLQTPEPRPGIATSLVPGTPIAVTICRNGPTRPAKTVTNTTELVHALDALPTSPASNGCRARSPNALPAAGTYELHFHYQSGPDVLVNVLPHCQPSINNLELQADAASTVIPLIEAALAPGS